MTFTECPWCDEAVELDLPAAVEVACETCGVRVELAADPRPSLASAA